MDQIKQAKFNSKVKMKDGELFQFVGKNQRLVKIDPLDVMYKDRIMLQYITELEKANEVLDKVKEFLTPYSDHPEDILESLNKLFIIDSNKQYFDMQNNKDGYINNGVPIKGTIVENKNIPVNFASGYFFTKDHRVIKDVRKSKLKKLL